MDGTSDASAVGDSFIDRAASRVMWVVVVGTVGLAVLSALTFAWGVAKTYDFARTLFEEGADNEVGLVLVLEGIDLYLLATVLLILAVGLFELFVRPLPMPEWLVIGNLSDLKSKVSDVIVLLLAIKFLEKVVGGTEPLDLVWYALSIVLVGALLIAFKAIRSAK